MRQIAKNNLTDIAICRGATRSKPYKLLDPGGLFLVLNSGGGKQYRFKNRFAGKERLLSSPYQYRKRLLDRAFL
jgi:hypothetical protein